VKRKQDASGSRFRRFKSRRIESSVDFAVGMEASSFRWNEAWSLVRRQTASGVSEERDRTFNAGLAVEDEFYRLGLSAPRGDRKRTYVLDDKGDYAFGPTDFRPHLTCFFGETLGSKGAAFFYDQVGIYVRQASQGEFDGSVRTNGDLVILRSSPDAEPYVGNEYVFDLSKGGNLVRWYASGGPGDLGEDVIDYEEHNGVWVPVSYKRRCVRGEDKYVTGVEYVFESQEVNEPLSPDEFTLAAIEARPGDEIWDRRTDTRHVYRPDALAENIEAAREAQRLEPVVADLAEAMPEEQAAAAEPDQAGRQDVPPPEPEPADTAEVSQEPPRYPLVALLVLLLVGACGALLLYRRAGKRPR